MEKRPAPARTIRLTLQYDGTAFVGWQRQAEGSSIQGLLEAALSKIDGAAVDVHGAGRTDAGVHALAQVASVRLRSPMALDALQRALNAHLPPAIRVVGSEQASDDFHARFSARGKTYEYRIWNHAVVPPFVRLYVWHVPPPLDVDAMRAATRILEGDHDFAAFQGSGSSPGPTIRRVDAIGWRDGRPDGPVRLSVTGQGFLRHMVRNIVGTAVEVGLGRRAPEDMARILESRDRSRAGITAPAAGLFLTRVLY